MPALTRSQLQVRVADLVSDPHNQYWTTTQINSQLQIAVEQFAVDTKAFLRNGSYSVVAARRGYTVGTGLIGINRVTLNNIDLIKTSIKELDNLTSSNWLTVSGTPTHYYIQNELGTGGDRTVNLYPIPTAADVGTDNLIVTLINLPDAMSDDEDYPFTYSSTVNPLFDHYNDAVAYLAAANLLDMNITPENATKANNYLKRYDKYVTDCINNLRNLTQTMRLRGGRYYKGL